MSASVETDVVVRPYGVVGEVSSAEELLRIANRVRERGFRHWDVFSPYPVHGMDAAMGLGKSPIGYIVFGGGLSGALLAAVLQIYPTLIEYPHIVHGKPDNLLAAPAFFPIFFELTVLLSAFACIIGMLVLNRLPRLHHPLFDSDRFHRVTDDGFFVVIESDDPLFAAGETPRWLEQNGAKHVHMVYDR